MTMRVAAPRAVLPLAAPDDFWGRIGDWLQRNQRAIRVVQWSVVAVYAVLLCVPVLLPLPGRAAFLWNDFTRFAQFVFWGVWWPFVLVATMLVGRMWCGLLCPEGAVTEFASSRGRGRATPRWMTWPGCSRKLAAFVERHAHVAAAMRDQRRDAELRREVRHVDPLHLPKQLRGDVSGCRHPLEIAPPAMLFRRPVGYEQIGEELAERRIVASPADANEVDEGFGLQQLGLRLRPNPHALTVGVEEHQMRYALGMPQGICDGEGAAL